MSTVNFLGRTWDVVGERTAEQVSEEFSPTIGALMEQEGFTLLLLSNSRIDLIVARIYSSPQNTVAFKDSEGNIHNPDDFADQLTGEDDG